MRFFTFCVSLMAAFLITACFVDIDVNDGKKFDYNLRGTWISNDNTVYSGTLKIDYDSITITGYSEDQTPSLGNDNRRPFKSFTKGVALKGYSDGGKIFINDGGSLKEGISYIYWETPPSFSNKKKFIKFNFGDRDETLEN